MTLADLLKRVDVDRDGTKMMIFRDDSGGWENVDVKVDDNYIVVKLDHGRPFND